MNHRRKEREREWIADERKEEKKDMASGIYTQWMDNIRTFTMSNSPVPTSRRRHSLIFAQSPHVRTSTPIADTSIYEKADLSHLSKTDLPVLLQADETNINSTTFYEDENTENEAVRKINRKLIR